MIVFGAYLTNVSGTLFFQADNGTNGGELWKSNGTAAGTVHGQELWKTNGTAAGTVMVQDKRL